MTFGDIPAGEVFFWDANVFIHYFVREISDSPVAIHEVTLVNLSDATAISAAEGLMTPSSLR